MPPMSPQGCGPLSSVFISDVATSLREKGSALTVLHWKHDVGHWIKSLPDADWHCSRTVWRRV